MVLNAESKYPNRRAYVLKLRGDATPDALAGRIENLVTGNQLEFASASRVARVPGPRPRSRGGRAPTDADA